MGGPAYFVCGAQSERHAQSPPTRSGPIQNLAGGGRGSGDTAHLITFSPLVSTVTCTVGDPGSISHSIGGERVKGFEEGSLPTLRKML